MKAVWYAEFGPAADVLHIGELDAPEPDPGEVRVRVAASGVNPVDVKRRAGGRGAMESALVIPHFDGAGVIDRVGAGVADSRVGERVWLYEAQWLSPSGSAAELVTVPASRAVRLSDNNSFAEGAGLGIPALTAHRCVFGDGPVAGQTLLVTGGAGCVGNYAIQFAKLGGARVITTVSSVAKAERANAAGADHVIDYRSENVAGRIAEITSGAGVDRIVEVEFGGNLGASIQVLKPNGVIASYASEAVREPEFPFYLCLYKNIVVRCELVFGMPEAAKQHAVADITRHLDAGELRHQVGERFPLDEAVAAHQAVERGASGKVVVDID